MTATNFGKRVRALRSNRSLSVRTLAARAGFSPRPLAVDNSVVGRTCESLFGSQRELRLRVERNNAVAFPPLADIG